MESRCSPNQPLPSSRAVDTQPHHKPASKPFSKTVIPGFSSSFVFFPFSLLAAVFLRAQQSLTSPCSAKTKRQSCKATAWPAKQGIFHICGHSLATCHLVYLTRGADQATRGPSALKPDKMLKLPRRRVDGSERAQQQLSPVLRAPGSCDCFPKASRAVCQGGACRELRQIPFIFFKLHF